MSNHFLLEDILYTLTILEHDFSIESLALWIFLLQISAVVLSHVSEGQFHDNIFYVVFTFWFES